jgi:hypothetical protein
MSHFGREFYGAQLEQLIAQGAIERKLEASDVLAVASTEGGFHGAVGDAGTSYGPFQLHVGGALPATIAGLPVRERISWAQSQAGVDYALDHIAKVAAGLSDEEAIRRIVTEFERPANPQAQIAKALERDKQREAQTGRRLQAAPGVNLEGVAGGLLERLGLLAQKIGRTITITSGYRSRAEQQALWDAHQRGEHPGPVARPGSSNHERGLAIDATIGGRAIADVVDAATLAAYGLAAPVAGDPVHIEAAAGIPIGAAAGIPISIPGVGIPGIGDDSLAEFLLPDAIVDFFELLGDVLSILTDPTRLLEVLGGLAMLAMGVFVLTRWVTSQPVSLGMTRYRIGP